MKKKGKRINQWLRGLLLDLDDLCLFGIVVCIYSVLLLFDYMFNDRIVAVGLGLESGVV